MILHTGEEARGPPRSQQVAPLGFSRMLDLKQISMYVLSPPQAQASSYAKADGRPHWKPELTELFAHNLILRPTSGNETFIL